MTPVLHPGVDAGYDMVRARLPAVAVRGYGLQWVLVPKLQVKSQGRLQRAAITWARTKMSIQIQCHKPNGILGEGSVDI